MVLALFLHVFLCYCTLFWICYGISNQPLVIGLAVVSTSLKMLLFSFLFHRRQFRHPSANTCYLKQCLLSLIVLVKSQKQVLYLVMGVWRIGAQVANVHLILGEHSSNPCFTLQVHTTFCNSWFLFLSLPLTSCMSLNMRHALTMLQFTQIQNRNKNCPQAFESIMPHWVI